MASNEIRKLLESFEQIDEGYEDRVNQVASIIKQNNSEGITRKDFASEFERAAQQAGAVEMRGSPQAKRDFQKDVMAKVEFKRDNSAATSNKERAEAAMEKLDWIINDAVGNAFPDGDPFDAIMPRARKLGIRPDDLIKWLDRWARKYSGVKGGWHAYLARMWDDQYADANSDAAHGATDRYDMMGGANYKNPWR